MAGFPYDVLSFTENTRVICDHLVIYVRTNKKIEERAVFLNFIDACVYGKKIYI